MELSSRSLCPKSLLQECPARTIAETGRATVLIDHAFGVSSNRPPLGRMGSVIQRSFDWCLTTLRSGFEHFTSGSDIEHLTLRWLNTAKVEMDHVGARYGQLPLQSSQRGNVNYSATTTESWEIAHLTGPPDCSMPRESTVHKPWQFQQQLASEPFNSTTGQSLVKSSC